MIIIKLLEKFGLLEKKDETVGKLYLVRHAKTALNAANGEDKDKIRGWKDIPLDEIGRKQAKELATEFNGIHIDKIYSSDLSRCEETAQAIAEVVDTHVESTEHLRPWHLGKYEGKESKKIADEVRDYVENKPDTAVDSGESFNTFSHRYLDFLQKIAQEVKDGKTIMIVTHYRDIKLTQAWLKNGGKGYDIDADEFMNNSIETGCSFEIEPNDGEWKMSKFASPKTKHKEIHKVEAGVKESKLNEETYKIVRLHKNGKKRVIQRGLSLEDAQAHCKDSKTHGEDWFDGYEVDESKEEKEESSKDEIKIKMKIPADKLDDVEGIKIMKKDGSKVNEDYKKMTEHELINAYKYAKEQKNEELALVFELELKERGYDLNKLNEPVKEGEKIGVNSYAVQKFCQCIHPNPGKERNKTGYYQCQNCGHKIHLLPATRSDGTTVEESKLNEVDDDSQNASHGAKKAGHHVSKGNRSAVNTLGTIVPDQVVLISMRSPELEEKNLPEFDGLLTGMLKEDDMMGGGSTVAMSAVVKDKSGKTIPQDEHAILDKDIKCEKCGNDKFQHFSDIGVDYDYCTKCGAKYDEDGKLIPEGPESVEESALDTTGQSAGYANLGAPYRVKPDVSRIPQKEEQDTKEGVEDQPDLAHAEQEASQSTKEYLGNNGAENYYYLVTVNTLSDDEGPAQDVQVVDADGEVKFSAKERQLDPSDVGNVIATAIKELEVTNVAFELVQKYIVEPQVETEEDIEELEKDKEAEGEEDTEDKEAETETPKEEPFNKEAGEPARKTTTPGVNRFDNQVGENVDTGFYSFVEAMRDTNVSRETFSSAVPLNEALGDITIETEYAIAVEELIKKLLGVEWNQSNDEEVYNLFNDAGLKYVADQVKQIVEKLPIKIIEIRFIETDSSNWSHASAYYKVTLTGSKVALKTVAGEESNLYYNWEDMSEAKKKSEPDEPEQSPEEQKLWTEHDKMGRKLFGKKRWEMANFGWGSSEDSVCTKVYGNPPQTFSSHIDKHGNVEHSEPELYESVVSRCEDLFESMSRKDYDQIKYLDASQLAHKLDISYSSARHLKALLNKGVSPAAAVDDVVACNAKTEEADEKCSDSRNIYCSKCGGANVSLKNNVVACNDCKYALKLNVKESVLNEDITKDVQYLKWAKDHGLDAHHGDTIKRYKDTENYKKAKEREDMKDESMNEEMDVYDADKGDANNALGALRNAIGLDKGTTPVAKQFLTYQEGTSNKYHYFAMFKRGNEYVAANAFGRIGYYPQTSVFSTGDKDTVEIDFNDKISKKMSKGYKVVEATEPFISKETRFSHPEGAESRLNTFIKRFPKASDKKKLADAFNRGWNPFDVGSGQNAVLHATEYLNGPKGYKKDTKESVTECKVGDIVRIKDDAEKSMYHVEKIVGNTATISDYDTHENKHTVDLDALELDEKVTEAVPQGFTKAVAPEVEKPKILQPEIKEKIEKLYELSERLKTETLKIESKIMKELGLAQLPSEEIEDMRKEVREYLLKEKISVAECEAVVAKVFGRTLAPKAIDVINALSSELSAKILNRLKEQEEAMQQISYYLKVEPKKVKEGILTKVGEFIKGMIGKLTGWLDGFNYAVQQLKHAIEQPVTEGAFKNIDIDIRDMIRAGKSDEEIKNKYTDLSPYAITKIRGEEKPEPVTEKKNDIPKCEDCGKALSTDREVDWMKCTKCIAKHENESKVTDAKLPPKPKVGDGVERRDMSKVNGNVTKIVDDNTVEVNWGQGEKTSEPIKNLALVARESVAERLLEKFDLNEKTEIVTGKQYELFGPDGLLGTVKIVSTDAEDTTFVDLKTGNQLSLPTPACQVCMEPIDVNEVAPPGGEYIVKKLKHKKGVNPYAVAWNMRNKGDKFHKGAHAGEKMKSVGESLLDKFDLMEAEPFISKGTRIPHPEGAEKKLHELLKTASAENKKIMVDAFNRGWNPLSSVSASDFMAGYTASRKELGESVLKKFDLEEKYVHVALINERLVIEQGDDDMTDDERGEYDPDSPDHERDIPEEPIVGEKPGEVEPIPLKTPIEPVANQEAPITPEAPAPTEELSSEAAEAQIRMDYPEEPLTSTAMAYADSIIDDPKTYGQLRDLHWAGTYANSEMFLKQAKIVGKYNDFSPEVAQRLVDRFGDSAKYKLAREGSVAIYITIRDPDVKNISLSDLQALLHADEVDTTENVGECRIWWD